MIASLCASRFRPSCTRLLIQRRRPFVSLTSPPIGLTRPPLRLLIRVTLSSVQLSARIDQRLLMLDQPGARGGQFGVRCFKGRLAIELPPLPQCQRIVGRADMEKDTDTSQPRWCQQKTKR
jgi:hypothetical protein